MKQASYWENESPLVKEPQREKSFTNPAVMPPQQDREQVMILHQACHLYL